MTYALAWGANQTNQQRMPSSLGDVVFEWFFKNLVGEDWDRAMVAVHDCVISTYYNTWCNLPLMGTSCQPVGVVDKILKCYNNLALEGKIPEFASLQLYAPGVFDNAYKPLFNCSGFDLATCWDTLWCLENKTLDGSIANGAILKPRTTAEYQKEQMPSSVVASFEKTSSGFFDNLSTWAKWGLVIGGTAAAAYLVNELIMAKNAL